MPCGIGSWGGARLSLGDHVKVRLIRRRHPVLGSVQRPFVLATLTLECELFDRERFRTQTDARLAVFDFIECWYNPRRRHSALDDLSPMMYEKTSRVGKRPVSS